MNKDVDRILAPGQIGRFRVSALLGRGGMGEVYKGYDPLLQRDVALKVVRSDLQRPDMLARLLREALACARLQHPNIVTIYEASELDGYLYIAMEFLKGDSLDVLLRQGVPPLETSLDVLSQVLDALAHAHAAGVIHRDVKPSNVHRQPDGRIKLLDFGLARVTDAEPLTRVGEAMGTPHYASPEQLTGGPIDHRTDVYSTGILAYELFTGRRPFGAVGDNLPAVVAKVMLHPLPPLNPGHGFPPELEVFLARAAAKGPDDRFDTASAMKAALRAIAADGRWAPAKGEEVDAPSATTLGGPLPEPPTAVPLPSHESAGEAVQTSRRPVFIGVMAVAVLASFAMWLLVGQRSVGPAQPGAVVERPLQSPETGPSGAAAAPTSVPRNAPRASTRRPLVGVTGEPLSAERTGAGDGAVPQDAPPLSSVPADHASSGLQSQLTLAPTEARAPSDVSERPAQTETQPGAPKGGPPSTELALSEGDETAIRALLQSFEAAFASQSTPELRRLQPSLQGAELALYESRFLGSRAYKVQLRNVRLRPVSTLRVAVSCTIEREITLDDDSRRQHSGSAALTVERDGEQWRVASFKTPSWW